MKKLVLSAGLLMLVCLIPTKAFAGEHVWGAWSTDDDRAMKSAFTMAQARVQSRGKGCIGRGVKDTTTENLVMEQNGDKVRYGVFISHHNGSCKIKKGVIDDIARETGIDVNKVIGAWVGG